MTMKESPRMMHPIAIFVTDDGSLPRLLCQRQNMSRRGAKMKMKNGFADWNHVDDAHDGQLVCSSAHVCIVLPCCSYTAQNTMFKAHKITSAQIRPHSSLVKGCFSAGATGFTSFCAATPTGASE